MESDRRAKRILVVEDNAKNLKLVSDILTYRGHEVLKAEDGESGVETALREVPDLVLMDIQLPGLDGLAAAKKIKADSRTARVPVLAVTAHALRGDSRKIRNAGCDGYITKPIQTREFIRVVEEALQIKDFGSREIAHAGAAATPEPAPQTRGRILVVDDEERNRKLIEATLSPRGYEVRHASNGEEALEEIGRRMPDLLLLDLMMPGMDGLEVTRVLREEKETRHLPIILLTAFADSERRIQGIEAGCDDFIAKPFDRTELTTRIRSLIRVSFYRTQVANCKKFDIVFRETGDGVVLTDGRWHVEEMNDSAHRLLEVPGGGEGFDLLEHLFRTRTLSVSRETLLDTERDELRFEIQRPETTESSALVLDAGIRKIREPSGSVASIVLTFKDATSRWEEERLKGDFLSSISHKLKTPLAVVLANSESLYNQYYGELSVEQKEPVQDILKAGQELLSHVNKLLAFVSPDTFHQSTSVQEEAASFFRYYLDQAPQRLRREDVSFHLDIDPELNGLLVAGQPITVILDNLVENAVKFNRTEKPRVDITARWHESDWVRIAVRDNGPGIPAEHQQKVFEKFYQVEKFHTGKVSGAGLGLPLARRVVESLGGKIWVESRLGEGTTFSFTAPARRAESPPE